MFYSAPEQGAASCAQRAGVVQVAFALVLLVASGLMIRTFQALRRVHPGFDLRARCLAARYIPALRAMAVDLVEALRSE